jgi:hypothetical protein
MNRRIIIGLILVFSLSACISSTNNIAPNVDVQLVSEKTREYFSIQTIIAREQLTKTPTPAPTDLSNLPKPWTEITTPTSYPMDLNSTMAIAPLPNSIIYRGPGANYRMACYVQEGTQLIIIGRTIDSSWLKVNLGQDQTCITMVGNIIREDVVRNPSMQFWILSSAYTISGNLSEVPIIIAVPTVSLQDVGIMSPTP